MIRLVRIARMTGDWEKVDAATKKMNTHFKKNYPQIKEISHWGNVTGPIDVIRMEFLFDSLAAEDEWVTAVMNDPVYFEIMEVFMTELEDIRDELYRMWEGRDI